MEQAENALGSTLSVATCVLLADAETTHKDTRAHTRTYGWDSTVSVIMHTVALSKKYDV